jgi:hypothetical protein
MRPLAGLTLLWCTLLRVTAAGSHNRVHLQVHSSATTVRHETLHVCSDRQQFVSIQRVNTKITVVASSSSVSPLPNLSIWFYPTTSVAKQLRVGTGEDAVINTTDWSTTIGTKRVPVDLVLPANYTCGACPPGFYQDGGTEPPFACRPCDQVLTVHEYCTLYHPQLDNDMCHEPRVPSGLYYYQCGGNTTESYERCPSDRGAKYYLPDADAPLPEGAAACERHRVCDPGEYREDRLPGRPCLSCAYSGEFGMQGVARSNATGGGGGVKGVHQNASCQCAKGRYYEGVNRVCLLCEPGTYQDREGLKPECPPCDKCHVSTAYGAEACGGCAGASEHEYWSKRQRACRPCPWTLLALEATGDFNEEEDGWIDVGKCANATLVERCETPRGIVRDKTLCDPGHGRAVVQVDFNDTRCVPCGDGTFSAGGMGMCTPMQVCMGTHFQVHSGSATTDRKCVEETRLLREPRKYPVLPADRFELTVSPDRQFRVRGVDVDAPTLYVAPDVEATIAWPYGHPVMILTNQTSRASNNTTEYPIDTPSQTTTVTLQEGAVVYYACEVHPAMKNGTIRAVANSSVTPVRADAHRTFNLSNVSMVICDAPAWDNATYEDTLNASWWRGEVRLPLERGVAPCLYQCRPGSRQGQGADAGYCVACEAGKVSAAVNAPRCDACEPGKYQDQPGQSACVACAAGTFSNQSGTAACTPAFVPENDTACPVRTHFVVNGSWSRNQSNCLLCPDGGATANATRAQYGIQHCYALSCNETTVTGSAGKYPLSCEPPSEGASCRSGEYKADNEECKDCSTVLTPYARIDRGVVGTLEREEQCHAQATCAPGYERLDSLTRLYQLTTILNQVDFSSRCVKSAPSGCIGNLKEKLECQDNTGVDRDDFEPQDAREKHVLAVTCMETSESTSFNASALDSCSKFFPNPVTARRRLLQVNGVTVCDRNQFFDRLTELCESCPAHTDFENFNAPNPASHPSNCTCQAGYFRAKNITGENAAYDCHPCGREHYCPGDDNPTCDGEGLKNEANTSCRCPDRTSALTKTAKEITDCIPDKMYRLNTTNYKAELCTVPGESDLVIFYRQGDIADGRVIVTTPCYYQCDAALYATHNASSGDCVCDPALHREWHEKACVCLPRYYESDGDARACVLCPANSYCQGQGTSKQKCPSSMLSPPGSRLKSDCQCKRGMYKDSNACRSCQSGDYCPDGIKPIACSGSEDKRKFLCLENALEYGQVCPPGKRVGNENECTDSPVDKGDTVIFKGYNLFINHRYWFPDEVEYRNLILEPTNIQNLTDGLDDVRDLDTFQNFKKLGVMAAELQMFCPGSGVIVLQDGSSGGALEGSTGFDRVFQCWSSAQLVDTARAVPQKLDVSPMETVSIPHLQKESAFFNHFLQPSFHLSWAAYQPCAGAGCLDECTATGLVRLDLRQHFRVPGASSELAPVPLDPATQFRYNDMPEYSGTIMLSDGTVHRVPVRDGEAASVVTSIADSPDTPDFVLHSRTWHYQSFQPTVIRGFCGKNNYLTVTVSSVRGDKASHDNPTSVECREGQRVFATTHLNRLYMLAKDDDSVHVTAWDMSTDNRHHKRIFNNLEKPPAGDVRAVQWHTACTLMHDEHQYCPLHAVILFRTDKGEQSSVGLVYKEIEMQTLFTASDVRDPDLCPRCLPPDGVNYTLQNISLLTPSTANTSAVRGKASLKDPKLDNLERDPLDCLDLLAFLWPSTPPSGPGLAHVVRATWCRADAAKPARLQPVPPVVVPGAIAHIVYSLVPTGEHHPQHANVLAVGGRVAVYSQEADAGDLHVHVFALACLECGDAAAAAFEPATNACVCRAGHAPVAVACTGADDCNTPGVRAGPVHAGTHIALRIDEISQPVAYVELCQPCTGQFYCTDGSVGGVQRCPAGRHALAPRAASERDCVCTGQTKSAGADAEFTACVACGDGEICNADVALSALRTLPCRNHSRARVDGDKYVCECDDGWHPASRAAFVLRREEEALFHREYARAFPFNESKQAPTTHWRSVKNLCLPCPADHFCANGSKTACPLHATAPPGSTAAGECACPAGSLPDDARGECVSCGAPRVDAVCVNNEKSLVRRARRDRAAVPVRGARAVPRRAERVGHRVPPVPGGPLVRAAERGPARAERAAALPRGEPHGGRHGGLEPAQLLVRAGRVPPARGRGSVPRVRRGLCV